MLGLCVSLAVVCAHPASAAEWWVLPSVFEDFEGPDRLRVGPAASSEHSTASLKAMLLIPAAQLEMGTGIVITGLALRHDGAGTTATQVLRGSITLETTERERLGTRFVLNRGQASLQYFVTSRIIEPPVGPKSLGHYFAFDLPGGYRFDPSQGDSLLVQLELEADAFLSLDLAPALEPRFIHADDLYADRGAAAKAVPVMSLWVEPDPRSPGPDSTIARGPRVLSSSNEFLPDGPASASMSWKLAELAAQINQLQQDNLGFRLRAQRAESQLQSTRAQASNQLPRDGSSTQQQLAATSHPSETGSGDSVITNETLRSPLQGRAGNVLTIQEPPEPAGQQTARSEERQSKLAAASSGSPSARKLTAPYDVPAGLLVRPMSRRPFASYAKPQPAKSAAVPPKPVAPDHAASQRDGRESPAQGAVSS